MKDERNNVRKTKGRKRERININKFHNRNKEFLIKEKKNQTIKRKAEKEVKEKQIFHMYLYHTFQIVKPSLIIVKADHISCCMIVDLLSTH